MPAPVTAPLDPGRAATAVPVRSRVAAPPPLPEGIERLAGSGSAIQFRVTAPAPTFETLESDREVSTMNVRGFQPVADQGEPMLPGRIVAVAVPPVGEVRVTASGTNGESFANLMIAAGFAQAREGAGKRATLSRDREEIDWVPRRPWIEPSRSADVRAELVSVDWLRNQRIARILVYPAAYDMRTRAMTFYHQIDVSVAVTGAIAAGTPVEDPDPFEGVYRSTVINYDQGRAWRRSVSPVSNPAATSIVPSSAFGSATQVPDTSVYAGRLWVKIGIKQSGFYRVRFDQVRQLSPFDGSTETPLDSLRLFTLPGLPVLPEDSYCDTCEFQEVAIGTQDDGNGKFDNNTADYIYFYALGPSDWGNRYDAALADTIFIQHPYTETNYYYLTIGTAEKPVGGVPRRIGLQPGSPAGATGGEITPARFLARSHLEVDAEYWPDVTPNRPFDRATIPWEKWFWKSLSRNETFHVEVPTPGADVSQPVRLRLRQWGLNFNVSRSPNIRDHYLDVRLNGVTLPRVSWDFTRQMSIDTSFVGLLDGTNDLSVGVPFIQDPNPDNERQRSDRSALAWAEVFYQRRFEPVNDQLEFESPGNGSFLYQIQPFTLDLTNPPRVFDITDPQSPIEITNLEYTDIGSGARRLRFLRTETGAHRYWIVPTDGIVRPAGSDVTGAPASSLTNLRSATQRADYVLVYYDGFKAAADTLANWRKEHLPLDGRTAPYEVETVPISALYDQFSGGRPDPGAMRSFLRSAFFNWSKRPAFVTMLGDASYDFKNILGFATPGQPSTLLPTYEGGYEFSLSRQFATDDWILDVSTADPPNRPGNPDFFHGRIPANTPAGAMTYVRDKLLRYERRAPLGEWRNRILLIADDNEQGSRPDGLGWTHLCQTSILDTLYTPPHMDRAYVYLHTYPDGPGDTKPGAHVDIMKALNDDGAVMFNYIGHGSAFKIADEGVFLAGDVGQLTNLDRLSFFIAASCDVGKSHDPQFNGIGEELVMSSIGGCIGVISATEEAFSTQNGALNNVIYQEIFDRDPVTGRYHNGTAEALLAAKIATTFPGAPSTNNAKYQMLGDAAIRLALPNRWVDVTLEDETGTPVNEVHRGQTITVRARVLDQPGGSQVAVTGSNRELAEDSAPIQTVSPAYYLCIPFQTYPFTAAPIFRGDVGDAGGQFVGRFLVPMDAVAGPRGKIRCYVEGVAAGEAAASDAVGSSRYAVSPGTAPAGDNAGPTIKLSFPGGTTSVRPDAVLKVDLFDPSGILITGHVLQNAIVVTPDDDASARVDISPSFRYASNSYQSGQASYPLAGLAPGTHTVKVSAADNLASGINAAQHRSSATITFVVTDNPPLQVQRAFLFPNPILSGYGANAGGNFVVDAPGDPVNVLLRIYTVSGKLIRTLKAFGGLGQVQIPWNGLDDEGFALANGTYLFHVHVNPRDTDGSSSSRKSATADGRFVVVGR